jgi:hypothetical protein
MQQLVELKKIIPAGAPETPIDEIGDPLPAVDFALVGAQQIGQLRLLCLQEVFGLHTSLLSEGFVVEAITMRPWIRHRG